LYNNDAYVWYNIAGLEADCATAPEGVSNACGIHIHEGMTCDDADSVGGHYYDGDSISEDPWAPVTYQASADGTSKGKTQASIGAGQDINGRAIVVHDKTGARVACALIEGKMEELVVGQGIELGPYPGYTGDLKVTGDVNAYLAKSGNAYVTYNLKGLEDACKTTPEGVSNACGIHIHEGMTCDDADAVGGHYYDADSVEADPWSPVGYVTRFGGRADGSVKAAIGQGQDIAGRAIVVHDSTGGRVACALLPSMLAVQV
jgi:Cu/Zn superoxide dismutase